MFKKNDLIKRFEETTKQEIINHNRAIEESNASINLLRDQVQEVFAKISENLGYQNICNQNTSQSLVSVTLMLEKKHKEVVSKINDFIAINEKNAEKFDKKASQIENFLSKEQKASDKVSDFERKISKINEEISQFKQSILHELDRFKELESDKFSVLCEEISLKPTQISQFNRYFSEKVDICSTNIDGLKKDMDIVKKDVGYMKKQIEHIYTLIERLTKKLGG